MSAAHAVGDVYKALTRFGLHGSIRRRVVVRVATATRIGFGLFLDAALG
jgi:hypothetical protein